MRILGLLLLVIAAVVGFAALGTDTTVETGLGGRVHNIGLMNEKQNLLIVAGVLALIGTLMALFAPSGHSAEASTAEGDDERPEVQFRDAIAMADLSKMTAMLKSKAVDVNGLTPGGSQTWLHYAYERGAITQCETLLENGADPRIADAQGRSVLQLAREAGSPNAFRQLCEEAAAKLAAAPPAAVDTALRGARTGDPAGVNLTIVDHLRELVSMREQGVLTPDEFEQAKRALLRKHDV